jgi:DNA-binding transcriptional regulator YiaG
MYRYRDCGLDDVWLVNGYKRSRTPYGAGVAIVDIEGLHKAIAARVTRKSGDICPREFKFLRKYLGLSQGGLAELIGADTQAIARWEKGKSGIPGSADRLLRALCERHAKGEADILEIVERLKNTDGIGHAAGRFKHGTQSWQAAA